MNSTARVWFAAGALAAWCLASGPAAQAAPFAGTYRGVHTSFSVQGADGATYDVDLIATQKVASVPAEQAIYLDVRRCTSTKNCQQLEHARKDLDDGAVSVSPDLTSATITTSVGGQALHLVASATYVDPGTSSVTHPGFSLAPLESASGGPNVRVTAYMAASGTSSIGSVRCPEVHADVFTYQAFDRVGDDARDPRHGPVSLPRGMLAGSHRPTCS